MDHSNPMKEPYCTSQCSYLQTPTPSDIEHLYIKPTRSPIKLIKLFRSLNVPIETFLNTGTVFHGKLSNQHNLEIC